MAPCDREAAALRRAHLAYERAHILTALRGVVLAAGLTAVAFGLHRMSSASELVAAGLAAALAGLGWRGRAWRRGALAGVLAGLPPLIAPSVAFALTHGGHCATCEQGAALPCLVACFATSALVGILVAYHAATEPAPRRFAIAAIATAALTGLLGCATTGLGGALGVVIGLVAGSVTGWIVAMRTAHA
ncbi:MAG: hypothetical protein E6J90_39480 [Deltaproteobacteria bacterium]|nr:MAG: hypothetical protein E6J90_39480 [Deltaproteobacteria bacterium]TMQ19131.1 MAG: hypothetical protein E6J91_06785 [Deltaproteobacteria bacterium]